MEPGFGKRLLNVLRAVYHMMRRGLCRKRLMMDLHQLLGRGKLAGRALRDLVANQPHAGHLGGAGAAAATSPSQLSLYSHNGSNYGGLDAAAVARVFEMMNAQESGAGGETPGVPGAGATPSPMLALSLGRSPAGARRLRVTDSPFPVEPEGVDERVNAEFDDYIKRFYEQLRLRVTDSPFPVEPEGVDERVNAEFDDYIKRFYEQLRLQQSTATP